MNFSFLSFKYVEAVKVHCAVEAVKVHCAVEAVKVHCALEAEWFTVQ